MTPEPNRPTEEVLRRVQGEFLEMPGLRLTGAAGAPLWGLDAAMCERCSARSSMPNFCSGPATVRSCESSTRAPLKASLRSTYAGAA